MAPLPTTLQHVGLASETFTLTLNKQLKPGPITTLTCKFSYIWDFPRNIGHATLVNVNNGSDDVNLWMSPLGVALMTLDSNMLYGRCIAVVSHPP